MVTRSPPFKGACHGIKGLHDSFWHVMAYKVCMTGFGMSFILHLRYVKSHGIKDRQVILKGYLDHQSRLPPKGLDFIYE